MRFDVWIYKMVGDRYDDKWQCILMHRIGLDYMTDVYLRQFYSLSKDALIEYLFYYINQAHPGNVFDYSIFYENATKMDRPLEIWTEYTKTAQAVFSFYIQNNGQQAAPDNTVS